MAQPEMETSPRAQNQPRTDDEGAYPDNPVLTRVWRAGWVESQHRGAWALVDTSGNVLEGDGAVDAPVFARSAIKSLQVLPLVETGAAGACRLEDPELALSVASHSGEAQHTEVVQGLLGKLGLSAEHLQCGPQMPADPGARRSLARSGALPGAIHNNCSGKHAGFLALGQHLGVSPEQYLDPDGSAQTLVRRAVADMAGLEPGELGVAVDGCSAPSFRLPLVRIALGLARVANPDGLARERSEVCQRLTGVVARYPELIAGVHKRLDTDLVRASGGRLFPKVGAEAVYVVGIRGADRALAVKADDGSLRGVHALVLSLLQRFGYLKPAEAEQLDAWRDEPLRNFAGLSVGRVEVVA